MLKNKGPLAVLFALLYLPFYVVFSLAGKYK